MDFNQLLNNSLGSSINFSKIKKYILIASGILLFLFILFIVLLFLFFSHILNFVTSYIPVVSEFLFTYAKDFYMGYFQEDLLALVQPFTNGVNGAELKSIIDNYVQNVLNSQNFSLGNLNNFISEIEKIISDGSISLQELESARKFLN